jgi:hypothetical protein
VAKAVVNFFGVKQRRGEGDRSDPKTWLLNSDQALANLRRSDPQSDPPTRFVRSPQLHQVDETEMRFQNGDDQLLMRPDSAALEKACAPRAGRDLFGDASLR